MKKEYVLAAILIAFSSVLKLWTLAALYSVHTKHDDIPHELSHKKTEKKGKNKTGQPIP